MRLEDNVKGYISVEYGQIKRICTKNHWALDMTTEVSNQN